MSKDRIEGYFRDIAPVWDYWHGRNAYYHRHLESPIRAMVPEGMEVLELGCGTGDLLASLRPGRGVGINLCRELTDLAAAKHPRLEFHTAGVDRLPASLRGFTPDFVVMNNMLDYVYDLWDLLERLKPLLTPETLLIATTNNPLWSPVLRLASRLGLRAPDSPRNFITNKDIQSVMELQGFKVVEQSFRLPVPAPVPVLSFLANALIPEIPAVRFICSVQLMTARLPGSRRALSGSVIIPCHNEEANIVECIGRVPALGPQGEIIVVDDGSSDATRARVMELMPRFPGLRLIACDRNRGKAEAVRRGFTAARNEVLMILDADMAVPPEELSKFFQALEEGRCDFVNGIRFVYPMQGRAMKTLNYIGNKAFCFLMSWILRQRVSDTLCGTKAFMRGDYLRMGCASNDKWGDFGLLFEAARLKLRILEIPVHYHERKGGVSKMRAFRDGLDFLRACLHGWLMLRFPSERPGRAVPAADPHWREIGREAEPVSA